ncbi:30S ribosome-binding factor RbfA [Bdellovibrionota bacterium FG-2]
MQENRRARLQAVIQEELSLVVPRMVKDPRIPSVTFTSVEVTKDGSHATVFVSLLGGLMRAPDASEKDPKAPDLMKECLEGLKSASGFLRRHLGKVLNVRHIPNLVFREDKGFENALRVNELLKQISEPKPE